MKKKILNKTIIPLFTAVSAVFVLASCDLELQTKYDFPDLDLQTSVDMTAWEFVCDRQDEFVFMKNAIEVAGYEDIYNDTSQERTFLLITDDGLSNTVSDAYLYNSGIPNPIYDPDNSSNGPQWILPADFSMLPVETVQNFLDYHIIDFRLSIYDCTDETLWFETSAYKTYGDTTLITCYWTRDRSTNFYWNSFEGHRVSSLKATTSNIFCTNGVMHAFDDYLEPPTKEVLDSYGVDY